MKKTKIVATIGPSSKEKVILEDMIINGMDVARFNMKYASLSFVSDIIYKIRDIDRKLKTNTAIIMDLEGPSIKINKILDDKAYFDKNTKIRIYMEELLGDSTKFSINYSKLNNDVKTNTIIYVNKGNVELKVLEKNEEYILCEVIKEGYIKSDSDIVLDSVISLPFISKKDRECIEFATKEKVDYIGLSLIRSAENVLEINDLLIENNNDHTGIISKIETKESLDEIDEIIRLSDGIMLDRESLGIEIPAERIPSIQKSLINKCHLNSKVSLMITEMESEFDDIRPSKAEISDISRAICDGVDSVVLTGETTIGKYPVGTINKMKKIAEASELDVNYNEFLDRAYRTDTQDITGVIAYSVVESSTKVKPIAIVIPTMNGYTAKKISRYKPSCPIIALTPNNLVAKSLGLYYGIVPVLIEEPKSLDTIIKIARKEVENRFIIHEGNTIIITGGFPFKEVKHTNFMKIEEL